MITTKVLIFWIGLFKLVTGATWYKASDGHQYLIEQLQSYNWLQALDECSRQNLQLAVIDSSSKNSALVSLLRSIIDNNTNLRILSTANSPNFWLGHQDEFNTKRDKNRSWYSSSSGQPIPYGYWNSGKPNNLGGKKHCTQISHKANFTWNDEICETQTIGYICEEHYQIEQCRANLEPIRQRIYQNNTHIINVFENIQNTIKQNNEMTRTSTNNFLAEWKDSSHDILNKFRKSLKELIETKPYLKVILADVGDTINGYALEAKEEMAKVTEQTLLMIEDVHNSAESSTNAANAEFAEKLQTNRNEIDQILVY